MRTFVIVDSSKRKARPLGILVWKPGANSDRGTFSLEVCSACTEQTLPLSLSFCARREDGCATPAESLEWVRSRIVPESRHNMAEVLRANGLAEYDEVKLLAACRGRSSDDDLLVYEIDLPQEFAAAYEAEGIVAPASRSADRIVEATRRRRQGMEVSYAFVGIGVDGSPATHWEAPVPVGASRADGPSPAAHRIGALIRAERRRQGLTQKQLAMRAGITQTVLSRTESGAGNPTLALLEDIAAALGMSLGITLE